MWSDSRSTRKEAIVVAGRLSRDFFNNQTLYITKTDRRMPNTWNISTHNNGRYELAYKNGELV